MPVWKILMDKCASLLGLVLLLPLLVALGVLVRLSSPGPVLYRQLRVGQGGRLFTIYKFRTMRLGSDYSSVSVEGDGRATSVGRWLRRWKLDELPELWNVLRGDMSLVGPRPDVPGFADRLTGEDRRVLELRPGLTGPATLKYANEEQMLVSVADPTEYNARVIWPDKVRLNLEYLDNMSFWMDLRLIWRTVFRRM
jgi:lipopolysaccharide/colanic/teichoic acid biosynthesis glycosyltransferase